MVLRIKRVSVSDAKELLDFMEKIYDETNYLSQTSEEFMSKMDLAKEEAYLSRVDHQKNTIILALNNNKIIGNVAINASHNARKTKHRCSLGISILKEYWHQGVGSKLMEQAISFAKSARYEQIELEVCTDNIHAVELYKKYGFEIVGTIPHGFKFNDNKYLDLYVMVLFL